MKKLFGILAACLCMACTVKPVGEIEEFENVVLNFSSYTMEAMTKANVDISTLSNYLDVFLVNGEDVIEVHQNKTTDENFGTISANLNKKNTYTVYAVAHKGNGASSLSEGLISFPDGKVSETFYYTTSFSPANTTSLSCVMNRVVGKFCLNIEDSIPDEVTKIRFTITGGATKLNASTGVGAEVAERVVTININSRLESNTKFNTYIFGNGSNTVNVDMVVDALTSNDTVYESHNLSDVPIKNNYVTTYTGMFFVAATATAGFTADNSWSNFDEISY